MSAGPCALGLDFGTASVRAVVIETQTGVQRGSAVATYRHGVIERTLPGATTRLGPEWALQHPGDYLEAMCEAVSGAVRAAAVEPARVVGIGIDFTSCTILPIDRDARPLCLRPEMASRPHAWVKLWKHHAAQPQADRINAVAGERGEPFLADYSGRTSSEWLCAKVLQIVEEDPAVYDAAFGFVEAGDWVASELCGTLVRNACAAGYKGLWSRERGFPCADFFAALHPALRSLPDKLPGEIVAPGRQIGGLTSEMASRLGLRPGTAVAAAIIDAHSAVPAATVVTPGRMVMVIGTSTCHMLLADRHAAVEGVAGVVADGIVALDWWNGNRSVLGNADLSGVLMGMTLATTRGDVYRSLLEATGFGTRRILDAFAAREVPVTELIAVGGLAERSPLLLQVYADITRRPIALAASPNASATGAAMLGAVAAGERAGGHASFVAAAAHMAALQPGRVDPDPARSDRYDALYREYLELHDHFGRGGTAMMSRLRRVAR